MGLTALSGQGEMGNGLTINPNPQTTDLIVVTPVGSAQSYAQQVGSLSNFSAQVVAPSVKATGAASAGATGQIVIGSSTATTATSGAGTLPGNPLGFLIAYLGATEIKIPYYAA